MVLDHRVQQVEPAPLASRGVLLVEVEGDVVDVQRAASRRPCRLPRLARQSDSSTAAKVRA